MSFMKLQLQNVFPRRKIVNSKTNTIEIKEENIDKIASSTSTIGLKQSNSNVSS